MLKCKMAATSAAQLIWLYPVVIARRWKDCHIHAYGCPHKRETGRDKRFNNFSSVSLGRMVTWAGAAWTRLMASGTNQLLLWLFGVQGPTTTGYRAYYNILR